MKPMRLHRRALLDLSLCLIIAFVLVLYNLSVNFIGPLHEFFEPHTRFPIAAFIVNALFLWTLVLLWVAYRRWREATRKQEELERILGSISPDVLIVVDPEGKILRCNALVRRMFGYEAEEVIGRKTDFLYTVRGPAKEGGAVSGGAMEREGFTIEWAAGKKKSGESLPLEIIAGRLSDRGGAVLLLRDLTWRKRAEESLRNVIAGARCLLWYAAVEEREDSFNWAVKVLDEEAAQGFLQLPLLPGQSYADAFAHSKVPADRVRVDEIASAALRSHLPGYRREFRVRRSDGQIRWLHEDVRIHMEGAGKWRLVGVCTDITERKLLEDQLRHAQRTRALGTLARGIAHDYNDMLGAILGFAALLKKDLGKESVHGEHLEIIENTARRGAILSKRLLAFAEKGRYAPRPLRLNRVVEVVLDILRETVNRKISIEADLDPELPRLTVDEGQMHQVVMNLCLNGCEAMPEGGRLTVSTRRARTDEAFFTAHPTLSRCEYVSLSISDTGVGMDAETKKHLFDLFFTTKEDRPVPGLGLAMVEGIIRGQGGVVEVESSPGKGSTFTVYLPAAVEQGGKGDGGDSSETGGI